MARNARRGMRSFRFLCAAVFVAALIGGTAAASPAGGPYTVNLTLRTHKGIELDPGVLFDACGFTMTADVTEVFNVQAHVLAAGIDDQGNLVPPLHVEQAREESLLIVPDDPTLPTFTGHSTAHVTNLENSPNAVSTNTITLRGTDGSHLLMHENVHVLLRPNGIDLFVDNVHTRCG